MAYHADQISLPVTPGRAARRAALFRESPLAMAERWAVAAYVKQLQRTASDPAAVEDSLRGLEIARVDSAAARRAQP